MDESMSEHNRGEPKQIKQEKGAAVDGPRRVSAVKSGSKPSSSLKIKENDRRRDELRQMKQRTTAATTITTASSTIGRRNNSRKQLTVCLLSFVAAILSLSPYISLHLTERVGLLLFEADLVQLRSSQISLAACFIFLTLLTVLILFACKGDGSCCCCCDKNSASLSDIRLHFAHKISKRLLPVSAIISALAYLSIVLIVPHIKQTQRLPLATFDCDASLITIENCHQPYTARGGQMSLIEAFRYIFFSTGDIDHSNGGTHESSDRLIRKLSCFKYNDHRSKSAQVPTKFLLHNCGLICKPQHQQYHQFSDDLNRQQSHAFRRPPYEPATNDDDYTRHNATAGDATAPPPLVMSMDSGGQVSLKVCFSDELNGGSSYKQYCITNLANDHHRSQAQQQLQRNTLTMGQLNALLRQTVTITRDSSPPEAGDRLQDFDSTRPAEADDLGEPAVAAPGAASPAQLRAASYDDDRATHYVNPIVQFESHFKDWPFPTGRRGVFDSGTKHRPPHLSDLSPDDELADWCHFRPIPPFIVNNKPFSDIKCSIEHEYTMTTSQVGSSSSSSSSSSPSSSAPLPADRIFLKKLSSSSAPLLQESPTGDDGRPGKSEQRCNIQCKVNILYQVRMDEAASGAGGAPPMHYYLPMKSCNMISGEGHKSATIRQYVILRSIADSALAITFILIDLLLLIESIDSKQFQLEQDKSRFFGLLLLILLVPLLIALQFDLTSSRPLTSSSQSTASNNNNNNIHQDDGSGHLTVFLNDYLLPQLRQLYHTITISQRSAKSSASQHEQQQQQQQSGALPFVFDWSYLLPVFNFTIIIFVLSISSKDIACPASISATGIPLIRVSSTEELGFLDPGKKSPQQQTDPTSLVKSSTDEKRKKKRKKMTKLGLELIIFISICLLMGTQFFLSLAIQSQIVGESFAATVGQAAPGKKYPATWFEFCTRTSSALFMLALAFIFRDELFAFFANLTPFKGELSQMDDSAPKRNQAKLLKYSSLALSVYSVRFFLLSNLNRESPIRFAMVFLFYLGEMFNFPLIWFVLTKRAHELLMEFCPHWHWAGPTNSAGGSTNQLDARAASASFKNRALNGHLIVQASLGFAYFVLARLIALTLHALNVGLHLHSDNVDWFITSFQRQLGGTTAATTTTTTTTTTTADSINQQRQQHNNQQQQQQQTNNSTNGGLGMFSPLPSERQTYLHASRLFLKHNSQFCLLMAAILVANLLYVKYQIWCEQKRTLNFDHKLAARFNSRANNCVAASSSTDEAANDDDKADDDDELSEFNRQLSLDLMRVRHEGKQQRKQPVAAGSKQSQQPPLTRLIYPSDLSNRSETSTSRDSPKARVLFHYQLDRLNDDNRSPSTSSVWSPPPPPPPPPPQSAAERAPPPSSPVVRTIAIERSELPPPSSPGGHDQPPGGRARASEEIERISTYRNKTVRILSDRDHDEPASSPSEPANSRLWARETAANSQLLPSPSSSSSSPAPPLRGKKKTISFADEATFIGAGDLANRRTRPANNSHHRASARELSERNYRVRSLKTTTRTTTIRTASPEPSIEGSELSVIE